MGRKVIVMVCTLALLFGLAVGAQAATHTAYDGTISSTYLEYFRDILAGVSINDHYVAFRSGQYEYTMIVGDLKYNGNTFNLDGAGVSYVFTNSTGTGYNATYSFKTNDITNFSLNIGDEVVYSDLGRFPHLEERGARYETITTVLLSVLMLGIVVNRIFRPR